MSLAISIASMPDSPIASPLSAEGNLEAAASVRRIYDAAGLTVTCRTEAGCAQYGLYGTGHTEPQGWVEWGCWYFHGTIAMLRLNSQHQGWQQDAQGRPIGVGGRHQSRWQPHQPDAIVDVGPAGEFLGWRGETEAELTARVVASVDGYLDRAVADDLPAPFNARLQGTLTLTGAERAGMPDLALSEVTYTLDVSDPLVARDVRTPAGVFVMGIASTDADPGLEHEPAIRRRVDG